jgi:hypothetical protein
MLRFFLLCIFTIFLNCGESSIPDVGSEAYLYHKDLTVLIVADSKQSYDQFVKAQTANDKYAFNQMVRLGRLFPVKNATRVLVLDLDSFSWKVRILQGEHKNRVGWVAYEYAKKK